MFSIKNILNPIIFKRNSFKKNVNMILFLFAFNSRSEVVDMFRERDHDLSGTMSFEEFCGRETRNELAFKAIDKNGDGYISRNEFKRICPNMSQEQIDRAFAKFDKDETGRINYREYCEMLNKRLEKSKRSDSGGIPTGTKKE